jgi:hypothetical protein
MRVVQLLCASASAAAEFTVFAPLTDIPHGDDRRHIRLVGGHFRVVIFNFVLRSFTSSRSKVEEEFARFQIDSPVHVVKCDEQDQPPVSDFDTDGLRERLERFVTFTLPSHIRSLIGGEARR